MEIPDLIPVNSSNIEAIGYDESQRNLFVGFRGQEGIMWVYRNVPSEVFEEMKAAGSVGGYYAKHVKPVYRGDQLWNMQGVWKMLK